MGTQGLKKGVWMLCCFFFSLVAASLVTGGKELLERLILEIRDILWVRSMKEREIQVPEQRD